MSFRLILDRFLEKARQARPFVRTKIGSRLTLLAILDFILLFFAPAIHGFVGAALFGCAASVFLVLIWRHYDRDSAIVPAILLCVPVVLDMPIYAIANAGDSAAVIGVLTALLVAVAAILLAAKSPLFGYIDRITDMMYVFVGAGVTCAGIVILAWLLNIIVALSWWILCLFAFLLFAGIFVWLVYSTAAYTATDGRRQARKRRAREAQERRYAEYRPRSRDTVIYNADVTDVDDDEDADDDFIDLG